MFQNPCLRIAVIGLVALALSLQSCSRQAPLEPAQSEKFINSLNNLRSKLSPDNPPLSERSGDANPEHRETFSDAGSPNAKEFRPYTDYVKALAANPETYARLQAELRPSGLSPEEWASIGDRVALAYIQVQADDARASLDKDIEALSTRREEGENASEKQAYIQRLKELKARLPNLNVPAADVEYVRSRKANLAAMLARGQRGN